MTSLLMPISKSTSSSSGGPLPGAASIDGGMPASSNSGGRGVACFSDGGIPPSSDSRGRGAGGSAAATGWC